MVSQGHHKGSGDLCVQCLLTEAGRFRGPEAIRLADSGGFSHQHEARATGVPHHRAHPPVVTMKHSIVVHIWPPTVHCHTTERKAWHKAPWRIKGLRSEVRLVAVSPRHRDFWPSQQQVESPQRSLLNSWCRALQPAKQRGADPDQYTSSMRSGWGIHSVSVLAFYHVPPQEKSQTFIKGIGNVSECTFRFII